MDNHIHIEGLDAIYYGRAYTTIHNVLERVWKLGEYQDLVAELDNYINSLVDDSDEAMLRNDINRIVYNFAVTNILAPKHQIILARPNVPDMELLSGLLDFIEDSYNPEIAIYDTIMSYINSDDHEPEFRLAMIIREYNDMVDIIDVYDGVSSLSQVSLSDLGARIDRIREGYDDSSDDSIDYYTVVSDADLDILDTPMFKYIVANNKFDLTLKMGLVHLDSLSGKMGGMDIARNLGALALLRSLDVSEAMDIINNMFYDHDTTEIFEYFNNILGDR